jgi:hypothetical protein
MTALSPYSVTTAAGIDFDYNNPQPEMIEPRALAYQLSLEGRWSNNTHFPYSVAQHSLLVASRIEEPAFRIYGLLHDAAEHVTRDLPTPFKLWLLAHGADVVGLEHRILASVWQRFDLPAPTPAINVAVDEADARALATEYRDVVKGKSPTWRPKGAPWSTIVKQMRADKVEEQFLARLDDYLRDATSYAGRQTIAASTRGHT